MRIPKTFAVVRLVELVSVETRPLKQCGTLCRRKRKGRGREDGGVE